ncbi:MAG: bile acid:sodium symporter family protein [Rhodospirillaceae bacterium]
MGLVTEIFLPAAIAFIMFSLGLGLTLHDFTRVFKFPRDFLIGIMLQMVILPLFAFTLVYFWQTQPELALGLMIIAAAPGGATSNILTAFAKGDVALSISLTAAASLLSVITIPAIVVFAHDFFVGKQLGEVSVLRTALGVFAIVTVPVTAGLLLKTFARKFAAKLEYKARSLSSILFVIILIGVISQERSNIIDYFSQAGLLTLSLNVGMMAIALLVANIFGSGEKQLTSIAIECGLQNGTLAITLSVLLFGDGPTLIPAAIYSLIMFISAFLLVFYSRFVTTGVLK